MQATSKSHISNCLYRYFQKSFTKPPPTPGGGGVRGGAFVYAHELRAARQVIHVCVCEYVCVCARARARTCVRAHICVFDCVCVYVFVCVYVCENLTCIHSSI